MATLVNAIITGQEMAGIAHVRIIEGVLNHIGF